METDGDGAKPRPVPGSTPFIWSLLTPGARGLLAGCPPTEATRIALSSLVTSFGGRAAIVPIAVSTGLADAHGEAVACAGGALACGEEEPAVKAGVAGVWSGVVPEPLGGEPLDGTD